MVSDAGIATETANLKFLPTWTVNCAFMGVFHVGAATAALLGRIWVWPCFGGYWHCWYGLLMREHEFPQSHWPPDGVVSTAPGS